jgi:hypothetical protein
MAFEPGTNRLVMYGGLASTPSQALSDTWTFTTSWTQLSPVGGAPPRWGHQMVTNTTNNRLITFGGRSPTITGLSNDTYEWFQNSWHATPTPNAPSPRFLYGMAYDSARDVVVLFGGRDVFGANNQTWEYNGITWQQKVTVNSPPAREEMGMVYDAGAGRTIVFGGCNEGTATIFGDTWSYDGNDWVQLAPNTPPTARFRGIMEYDSQRGRSVYFGGFDGTQQLTETYEFAGGQWNMVPTGNTIPTSTTEMTAGYDPVRRKLTMFAGFGTTFNNDTWQYTGPTSGLFTLYGFGCDTAAGAIGLTATTPNINSTLNLEFNNLGTAQSVIVVLGLSDQIWNGLPLPFDLTTLGLPGCGLLAAANFLDASLATAGVATYSVPIPNQANLVSQSLYTQGIAVDLLPSLVFVGTSRGGRALIGQ